MLFCLSRVLDAWFGWEIKLELLNNQQVLLNTLAIRASYSLLVPPACSAEYKVKVYELRSGFQQVIRFGMTKSPISFSVLWRLRTRASEPSLQSHPP